MKTSPGGVHGDGRRARSARRQWPAAVAAVAGVPLPATVVMTPVARSLRGCGCCHRSAMKRSPRRPPPRRRVVQFGGGGRAVVAAVAGRAVAGDGGDDAGGRLTSRTRLLPASAMKRLPAASTATPVGQFSSAAVAGPPSPL